MGNLSPEDLEHIRLVVREELGRAFWHVVLVGTLAFTVWWYW